MITDLCLEGWRGRLQRPKPGQRHLRCPSLGDGRGVVVGDIQWGSRVCSGVFDGRRKRLRQAGGPRGQPPCLVERSWRRPPQLAGGRGRRPIGQRGLRTCRPCKAQAVPLLLVTWNRRGIQIQRCSRKGAPPQTPGRQSLGTSRARCEGTACPWLRVCSTRRR